MKENASQINNNHLGGKLKIKSQRNNLLCLKTLKKKPHFKHRRGEKEGRRRKDRKRLRKKVGIQKQMKKQASGAHVWLSQVSF